MKKRVLSLGLIIIILINFVMISVVSAELNLKIIGAINGYYADVRLKTNSNSVNAFDVYDMKVKSPPSNSSSFYSSVSGLSLAIDSWNSADNPRTLDLVYSLPSALSEDLDLSWNIEGIGSGFTATLQDYGDDSSYTTQVGSDVNMRAQSSIASSLTSDSYNYYQVTITSVVAEEQVADSGGGGGGGGSAPTKKTELLSGDKGIFIGNQFIDIYSGLGKVKTRKIELYNEADSTISGTLRVEGDEIADLIQLEETSFSLGSKKGVSIPLKIIIAEDTELGKYFGKIIVEGEITQEIEVIITVSKQELLFDAGLEVPWDFKIIEPGINLPVQVTLIPMVDNPRFDVKTSYTIRDFEGREFYKDSKTFLIDGNWNEKIEFPTGDLGLSPGRYVLELELEYPYPNVQAVASSRSSFEIRSAGPGSLLDSKIILFILGISILILILVTLLIIRRYNGIRYKKKKSNK